MAAIWSKQVIKVALILLCFQLTTLHAEEQNQGGTRFSIASASLHISCNRGLRDLANHKLECFGNVYVKRPAELLTADYASLDLKTNQMHAEGNVVYFTLDMVMYGAKADFNFNTETGMLYDGKIESDKYELLGEKIQKLSSEHFKILDGEYSTCRDCPASWKIKGHHADVTVNGYAFMSNVLIKINDAPTLYLPYMIFPVKKQRQTGFLMPKNSISQQNGFTMIEPFYWAISRSQDATLGLGFYSKNGLKGEGEYRYTFADRTKGQLNSFYLKDRTFVEPYQDRWALNYSHNIELPAKIDQKLMWLDASDRDYARRYPNDIPGEHEPALVSDAGLSRSDRNISMWVSTKRIRNNLTPQLVGFDPNTVQLAPSVSIASKDHRFIEGFPLHWGITGNYSRFWRVAPSFDPIYPTTFTPPSPTTEVFIPGQTPLRRAQRFNVVPELYYTGRAWDVLEVTPSVQYRAYHYLFDQPVAQPLTRGYLVAQTEVATTLEHVYNEQVKHKFRPSLTYSNIPIIQQNTSHPFSQQIQVPGNQFDDLDIVPISTESIYFVPLGNSLTWRLGNKFILKEDEYSYKKIVDITAGQSFNFIELRNAVGDQQPLSRFFTLLSVQTKRIQASGEYYYYPYIDASTYSLDVKYIFSKYKRRLLSFERSFQLRYNEDAITTQTHLIQGILSWSFNDYFATQYGLSYQFPMGVRSVLTPGVVTEATIGVAYQSPSQCYQVILIGTKNLSNGWGITFSLPINLSGDGFVNFSESDKGGLPANSAGGGLY